MRNGEFRTIGTPETDRPEENTVTTHAKTERQTKRSRPFGKNSRIPTWKEKVVAIVLSATVPMATMPSMAFALPHGGRVTKGTATLSYGTNRLLITQSTSQASFSWTGFNVGSAQTVKYRTPGSSSVSMNFIGGTTPAVISGKVTSNGILYFMDANGLVFGQGSTVSAAGIRAYGEASPGSNPTGSVTNEGTLVAGPAGQVVLVGTDVTNSGTIDAPSGQVILAAGSTVTVSQTSSSSLSVAATGGGTVTDSGVIEAENLDGTPGAIVLKAGMTTGTATLASSAVLDASAPAGGNGGTITVDAHAVSLDETAPLDVGAPYGIPGTVSIDPSTLSIGTASGLEAIDPLSSQSQYLGDTIDLTANIDLQSGSTPYPWIPLGPGSSSTGTFNPFTGTFNGDGHTVSGYKITASSDCGTGFIGELGSGGTVENLGVAGKVNGGSYSYIGGVVGYNSGTVKGSWNTGNVSGTGVVGGVVGYNGGTVETSYNTGSVSGSYNYTGGVVGNNSGTVETSYNTGSVSGNNDVGGVAGDNFVTVEYSYNTGNVSGSYNYTGGVVGKSNGKVEYSYNTGSVSGGCYVGGVAGYNTDTVEYSYNTENVSGTGIVGGVVGYNTNTVEYSYNTGNVRSLLYGSPAGGVVGQNSSGTYTSDYWNTSATISPSNAYGVGNATSTVSGVSGLTSSEFRTASNFSGWTCANSSGFNTFSSGAFQSSSTIAPWFIGSVGATGATITAPMLVADLPVDTVTGSGTSVYNGASVTAPYTQSVTMGGFALTSGITATAGPNVGTTTVTPTVSLSAPTTQTSVGSYLTVSGTWTITPAPLTVTGTTAVSRTYNGTDAVSLVGATLSGTTYGTAPILSNDTTGTLGNSGNAGTDSVTTAMTLTGTGAGNYSLTQPMVSSVTITPAKLTLSGSLSNPTMIYDGGTTVALTPSNSSATLSGFVSGQGATYTGATGTFSSSSVGPHTVTATLSNADFSGSGFSWSNYSLQALTLSGPGTILPANDAEGFFSNLAVPPPIENIVENMNQNSSLTPHAASSSSGGNVNSSGGNGGTGDGILDVSDLPK